MDTIAIELNCPYAEGARVRYLNPYGNRNIEHGVISGIRYSNHWLRKGRNVKADVTYTVRCERLNKR